jgi:hypothetical protein
VDMSTCASTHGFLVLGYQLYKIHFMIVYTTTSIIENQNRMEQMYSNVSDIKRRWPDDPFAKVK